MWWSYPLNQSPVSRRSVVFLRRGGNRAFGLRRSRCASAGLCRALPVAFDKDEDVLVRFAELPASVELTPDAHRQAADSGNQDGLIVKPETEGAAHCYRIGDEPVVIALLVPIFADDDGGKAVRF